MRAFRSRRDFTLSVDILHRRFWWCRDRSCCTISLPRRTLKSVNSDTLALWNRFQLRRPNDVAAIVSHNLWLVSHLNGWHTVEAILYRLICLRGTRFRVGVWLIHIHLMISQKLLRLSKLTRCQPMLI